MLREIEKSLKPGELIEYGPEKLPAGNEVEKSNTIIVVEGRADVINLMRYGYNNVIAIEGARGEIPETIKELSKKKKVIAFVDGDHAGELILRELVREAKVDLIARAPKGKEVEDLTGKEIARALENAIPIKEYLKTIEKKPEKKVEAEKEALPKTLTLELPENVIAEAKKLPGTLEAIIFDESWNIKEKIPVRDLYTTLKKMKENEAKAVIFDGIITQRILDAASEKKIPILVGARIGNITKRTNDITLLTLMDILS